MTKPLVRFVLLTIAALTLLALLVPLARAEPPKLTLNTECGAAGVGKVWGKKGGWRTEPREAAPGQRVNGKGVWRPCDVPPDCPAIPVPKWGGGKCYAPAGTMLKPKMVGGTSMVSEYPRHPLNRLWMTCTAPASPGASAAWAVHREVCK